MKRPLPRHCEMFLKIAKRAKLSYPLGRALYSCNGIQNGRFRFAILAASCQYGMVGPENLKTRAADVIKQLKTIRESTAKRWIKH